MVKGGSGEHQAVDQGDSDTCGYTLRQFSEHSAGGGTVQVKLFAIPTVKRGYNERLAVNLKSDVREKASVEDLVDGGGIVKTTFWQSAKLSAICSIHF